MAKGQRLDITVMELGLFASRETARTAIMDGAVLVDGQKVTKPGINVNPSAKIELIPNFKVQKFVSRGGLKLERALQIFSIDVTDRICVDVGASTGGFTDCLLKSGAAKVYAVDVGYGQLDWSLRTDERVVVRERINARNLEPKLLYDLDESGTSRDQLADFAVMDVSFISIRKVIPAVLSVLKTHGSELVCLVKPQFEAGRERVGKGGVVSEPESHKHVLNEVVEFARTRNLSVLGLTYSPVKGPAGNIEFLIRLTSPTSEPLVKVDVDAVVAEAHEKL